MFTADIQCIIFNVSTRYEKQSVFPHGDENMGKERLSANAGEGREKVDWFLHVLYVYQGVEFSWTSFRRSWAFLEAGYGIFFSLCSFRRITNLSLLGVLEGFYTGKTGLILSVLGERLHYICMHGGRFFVFGPRGLTCLFYPFHHQHMASIHFLFVF